MILDDRLEGCSGNRKAWVDGDDYARFQAFCGSATVDVPVNRWQSALPGNDLFRVRQQPR
ncbi:MAG: hypothetical protein IPH43_00450 [Xanthomonadales bacterium]|uniref:hypothetical protein n=1 Tax=Dokdonella sp. TaxID=2291710 RepID=UPI002C3BCCA1|nr:hypothetical protein [Xanthomonadales bacterium]MBK7011326.1 hypothetical protein [Xanthomonadales bacterium]MBK7211140.1 hypothetical protein [Xanthomonadales bacterium]MBL0221682.1 hypothetical protein [Xanthomonadales bacterium]HQY55347.1 hypothetical protein [Dokdonella sp.]